MFEIHKDTLLLKIKTTEALLKMCERHAQNGETSCS